MKTILRLVLGILLLPTIELRAATLYVSSTGSDPTPPYDTWAKAASSIQDAVDAAANGAEIVVTNGIYDTGGYSGNRVVVNKAVTLRSVNGPQFTMIQGSALPAIRCVLLESGAVLRGFTLTGGVADANATFAGGVFCSSNAVVVDVS